MRCFNCDYQRLTKDMKNCPICGVGLSRTCNKCNSFNPSLAKFCFECGNELDIKSLIHEEKHQKMGVIFADISGFTSLAERFSPEETKEIINECFNVITEPVYKAGGKIDKFIGDCVMAVFGLTDEYDVPFKTIECAINMRDKMNDYIKVRFANKDIVLNLSIGATYGDVVLGNVGTRHDSDYTIIGNIVNVASRLQEYAKTGEILVNDLLHDETINMVEFGELKQIELKNKKNLVVTYSVKSIISKIDGDSIFIHREEENSLRIFLNEDATNSILQVIGEYGSGKTILINKLSEEFNSIIISLSRVESEIPYSGISQIIIKLIKVTSDDDASSTKNKLESYIRYILSDVKEEAILRNLNFMSLLLKLDRKKEFEEILHSMDYHDLINEIKEQFNYFINQAIDKEKVVLFIEDSDFIDTKSMQILSTLNDFKGKIVFGSISRLLDSEEFSTLHLNNFNYLQVEEYTNKYFKTDISKVIVATLFDLTNGNPLYLSELCKYIDNSEKNYKNNELILSDLLLNSLPKTLSVIHSNVYNSFNKNYKEYLRIASAFLNEFDSRVVFKVLGTIFDEEVEHSLLDLNIIELYSYYRHEGTTYKKFTFRQPEFKSVIYNAIVKKEQIEYHTFLAKYYEEMEQNFDSIAFHYEKAEEISIAKEYVYKQATKYKQEFDLDQAVSKYIKYLDLERKLERYSIESRVVESLIEISKIMLYKSEYEEVIRYINEGMEIYQDDDELHQLQLLLIEYYKATANMEKLLPILDELERTLQKTSRNYGKLLQLQCTIYNMIGKPGVIELSDKSKDILLKARDFDSLAETLTQAGIRYYIQGDIGNGISYLESALDYANQNSNIALSTKIMTNLGILYNSYGEREKSHSYFKKAMKLSLAMSNNRTYISSAINLGVSYLKSGNFNNSKGVLQESVILSRKSNLLYQQCISLTNLADVNYELGEYDEAKDLYIQSKDLSEQMNLPIEKAIIDLGILKVEIKKNNLENLDTVFNEIINIFVESEEYSYVSSAYYAYSDYHLINNDLTKSLENIEKSIEFAEIGKSDQEIIRSKRKKVELLYIAEDIENAYAMFNELRDMAANSNNYYELAKLYLSRYLCLDKSLHNTEYLTRAEEISSYFDECSLTQKIRNEILVNKNR